MSKMGDRVRVIRENYRLAKEHDPRLGLILAGLAAITMAVFIGIGLWTGNMITFVILGVTSTILVLAIVFSRRAMRSAYRSIEGRPGAAVAVIENMAKRGWGVTGGVAANKSQDMVHRAVGRPGVVMVGEGTSPALGSLMAAERKRTARFVPDIPITEIVVGNEEGQIRIAKLDKYLTKMPKVLAPGEVTSLRRKLDALAATPVSMPKGPMPKSARGARGGKLR